MSAANALKAARDAGIELSVDGEALVLEAPASPPSSVIDLLTRQKAGVIALLRDEQEGWSADDWLAFFDERAGIAEFDGGLLRPEAEALAFACCLSEWLNRNPVHSPPGRCLGCGADEQDDDPVLPFASEARGHAWLHARCWSAWHARRKAKAVAALVSMGIEEGSQGQ